MLNIVDEFTPESLAVRVARRLNSSDVIDVLSDLFIMRGVPTHIRSDNGPEFMALAVQAWITAVGAKTAYITPGSPWENGYVESFNARLRDAGAAWQFVGIERSKRLTDIDFPGPGTLSRAAVIDRGNLGGVKN
jgi:transposase InsO family protein